VGPAAAAAATIVLWCLPRIALPDANRPAKGSHVANLRQTRAVSHNNSRAGQQHRVSSYH